MFTGIVEEIGQIAAIRKGSASAVLSIQASKVLEGTKIGDSIAVNGICLTVTGMQERSFTADVMAETLRRSSRGVGKRCCGQSGTRNGGRWQIWRTHCVRSY